MRPFHASRQQRHVRGDRGGTAVLIPQQLWQSFQLAGQFGPFGDTYFLTDFVETDRAEIDLGRRIDCVACNGRDPRRRYERLGPDMRVQQDRGHQVVSHASSSV